MVNSFNADIADSADGSRPDYFDYSLVDASVDLSDGAFYGACVNAHTSTNEMHKDICFTTTTGNQTSKNKNAAKFKKRAGAKAVNTCERNAAGADGVLNRQAATTYRAVSARTNYLAADRADSSYSSKGLRRDFEHSQ